MKLYRTFIEKEMMNHEKAWETLKNMNDDKNYCHFIAKRP